MPVPPAGTADLLAHWMNGKKPTTATATRPDHGSDLRFAFYGRTSTTRHQDRVSSQGWQRDMAEHLIGGHGQIVAAFFDTGTSRRIPWKQRPQAAQLITSISAPERSVDAVVIGEYERAFTGTQFVTLYAWCTWHGVQLWLAKTGGPVDLGDRDHRALMSMLATQSQRELLRARHRVLAAMHNHATQQGRYLGGRPSYGYQLVDAGPHPNPTDARWSRRLQRWLPTQDSGRNSRQSIAADAQSVTACTLTPDLTVPRLAQGAAIHPRDAG